MTNDKFSLNDQAPHPNWTLPAIVHIDIQPISYQPKALRNFESTLNRYQEAIEFIVTTESPIPIRSLGPALFVGDKQIIECEALADDIYRFLSFEIDFLKKGTPIKWGWINDTEDQLQMTSFVLEY